MDCLVIGVVRIIEFKGSVAVGYYYNKDYFNYKTRRQRGAAKLAIKKREFR